MVKALFTIHSPGKIQELHNISGPVLTPVELSDAAVVALVRRGAIVYAHNPYDTTEKIKLTYKNMTTFNFRRTREQIIKKNAKVVEKGKSSTTPSVVVNEQNNQSNKKEKKENGNKNTVPYNVVASPSQGKEESLLNQDFTKV